MTTIFRQRLVKNSDLIKFDKLFIDVLTVLMRATAAITVFSLKRRDDRKWGAHLVKTALGSFVIEPTGGTIGDEYRLNSVKRNIKQRDILISKIISPKLFQIKEDVFTMAGYTITVVGPDLPGQKTHQKSKANDIPLASVMNFLNNLTLYLACESVTDQRTLDAKLQAIEDRNYDTIVVEILRAIDSMFVRNIQLAGIPRPPEITTNMNISELCLTCMNMKITPENLFSVATRISFKNNQGK